MENIQPKKFYQKKWFWIVLGIVLIIWIASSDSSTNTTSNNTNTSSGTPTQVEQPKEEVVKVTATKLAEDYDNNEVAADQKYKGKTLEITGTLKSIEVMLGSQFITIEGNQIFSDIQCFFDKSKESELAALQKNRSITVRGRVDGKSLNVGVKECEIVK